MPAFTANRPRRVRDANGCSGGKPAYQVRKVSSLFRQYYRSRRFAPRFGVGSPGNPQKAARLPKPVCLILLVLIAQVGKLAEDSVNALKLPPLALFLAVKNYQTGTSQVQRLTALRQRLILRGWDRECD